MSDRYTHMDGLAGFGFLINAMGGGGDAGQTFPRSDAEDMSRGARFVPGEVTMARRRGERVEFVTRCSANCWYWQFPDKSRVYHFSPLTYDQIGHTNGKTPGERGQFQDEDGAGPCPGCGNPFTSGGRFILNGDKYEAKPAR